MFSVVPAVPKYMVARNHESALCELNPVAGTGCIPCPRLVFRCGCDFSRLCPSFPVIFTGGYPDSARCFPCNNPPFRAVSEVFCRKGARCVPVSRSTTGAGLPSVIGACGDSDLHRLPALAVVQNSVSVQYRYSLNPHRLFACPRRTPTAFLHSIGQARESGRCGTLLSLP